MKQPNVADLVKLCLQYLSAPFSTPKLLGTPSFPTIDIEADADVIDVQLPDKISLNCINILNSIITNPLFVKDEMLSKIAFFIRDGCLPFYDHFLRGPITPAMNEWPTLNGFVHPLLKSVLSLFSQTEYRGGEEVVEGTKAATGQLQFADGLKLSG
ncbi:hypothetical protein DFS34DRAFT_296318 [Phlyctochytrium arcticum]|nr:hypothetical protein DFS34DRAFT_296318 [Phlyctochytrium arcticum]